MTLIALNEMAVTDGLVLLLGGILGGAVASYGYIIKRSKVTLKRKLSFAVSLVMALAFFIAGLYILITGKTVR
jgi:hypothetical protein